MAVSLRTQTLALVKVQLQRSRRDTCTPFMIIFLPVVMIAIALTLASSIHPISVQLPPYLPALAASNLPAHLALADVIPSPSARSTFQASVVPVLDRVYSQARLAVLSRLAGPLAALSASNASASSLHFADFDSASAVANADFLALSDSSATYYPGGFAFPDALFTVDASGASLGYQILVDDYNRTVALSSLIASASHVLANTNSSSDVTSAPNFFPLVSTFQSGFVFDTGSAFVPPFIVNGLQSTLTLFGLGLLDHYETGSASQLFLSGMSPLAFFLASAVCDYLLYLVTVAIMLVLLLIVGRASDIACIMQPSFAGYALPMILFGLTVIPQGYCLSFLFKTKSSFSALTSMLVSFLVFVPWSIVNWVAKNNVSFTLDLVLSFLLPNYGLLRALTVTALSYNTSNGPVTLSDVFDPKQIILPVMLLSFLQSAGLFALSYLLMELRRRNNTLHDLMSRRNGRPADLERSARVGVIDDEEEDVAVFASDAVLEEETARLKGIQAAGSFDDAFQVVVEGLGKVVDVKGPAVVAPGRGLKALFATKPAEMQKLVILNDLWFGVKKGACFGFLGPNGAGKSTTMKIISGLEACTWGQVRFSSSSKGVETLTASHQPTEFLAKSIGYCPQHDALWPQVTAREHLTLYATLRGVLNVHAAVEESLTESAVEHPDLPVKGLSGGNKRRLMLAVATIGNPALLLLDEPTTGVDVSIRRSIWSHITRLKRTCAVLLTSHSMEEVDALSDRVGILVNGGLRCLGTGSRLKSAYGSGYTLTVKVRAAETAASVAAWFPSGHVVLRSSNGCTVVLDVVGGREGLKEVGNSLGVLKRIFDVLREHAGEVEDYGVSQPTLQQVFVDFAKKQREMRE